MYRRLYRTLTAYASAMWRLPMLSFHQKLPQKLLYLVSLCRYAILEVQILMQLLFLRT